MIGKENENGNETSIEVEELGGNTAINGEAQECCGHDSGQAGAKGCMGESCECSC